MRISEILFENQLTAPLFHFTDTVGLYKILKTNRLGLTDEEADDVRRFKELIIYQNWDGDMSIGGRSAIKTNISSDAKPNQVSFTRISHHFFKDECVLVINKEKLAQKYRIGPYNKADHNRGPEAEERIQKIISPAIPYIESVVFDKKFIEDWRHNEAMADYAPEGEDDSAYQKYLSNMEREHYEELYGKEKAQQMLQREKETQDFIEKMAGEATLRNVMELLNQTQIPVYQSNLKKDYWFRKLEPFKS